MIANAALAAGSAIARCVAALQANGAKKATVYLSSKLVVSACRRFRPSRRARQEDFVLKLGAPNYLERKFLKACLAAGEPLPVKRVQLRDWPRKRA